MDGDEGIRQLASMGVPFTRHGTRASGVPPMSDAAIGEVEAGFRFTKYCDEYKFLEKLMNSGHIKASDRSSDIQPRYRQFDKIKKDSFRGQFNKLKSFCGLATKGGKWMSL